MNAKAGYKLREVVDGVEQLVRVELADVSPWCISCVNALFFNFTLERKLFFDFVFRLVFPTSDMSGTCWAYPCVRHKYEVREEIHVCVLCSWIIVTALISG